MLSPRNLKLPFWLFNFDEIVDVLFAGRPGIPEELDILAEVIPSAKAAYGRGTTLFKRGDAKSGGSMVDNPVPYRIAELLSGEGISVARRTVAKYREAMGIPASSERRRAGTNHL